MDAGYVLWPIGQSWGRTVERAQHQLLLNPLFLGIPVKARYGLAKRPSRRGRWRPSHSVKRPDCLRRLAPQSRFVAAHAVKQGRVKIGETQEILGDGAGLRTWNQWPAPGHRQGFFVDGGRIFAPVRARGYLVAIGLSTGLQRCRLTESAGGSLPACEQKFGLHLKQAGFDGTSMTKSPQQACQPVSEHKLER